MEDLRAIKIICVRSAEFFLKETKVAILQKNIG